MPKPASLPEWASSGAGVTEPSAAKKALGWVKEKVPYQWLNWWMALVYDWIAWLNGLTGADLAVSAEDARTLEEALIEASVPPPPRFSFLGGLSRFALIETVVWHKTPTALDISEIEIQAGDTPASGSIAIDVLHKATAAGAVASLYTANTPPSLACTGSATDGTFSGANLPDTTAIAAGEYIGIKITGAPDGARDLMAIVR